MTTQILDRLIYQENEHFIYGVYGNGLPSPKDFGLSPSGGVSTCLRNYYMIYTCQNNNLYLHNMTVFAGNYPATHLSIEGFTQYRNAYETWMAVTYTGLSPVNTFTGGLLIGRILRRDLPKSEAILTLSYWLSCQVIIELKFNNGIVQEELDHSDEIQTRLHETAPPDFNEVKNVLSANYDFNYPITLAYGKNFLNHETNSA